MNQRTRGISFALAGTALWSLSGIFTSYLLTHYTIAPLTLAFLRDVIATLFVMVVLFAFKRDALRIGRRDIPFFIVYGCIGLALMNGFWVYSVQYNGAAVATVLAYSSPAFTVLLARPLLKEPWTPAKVIAVILSLAGCVLVAGAQKPEVWRLNLFGILTGVGTGLVYALFGLAGRWNNQRFASSWTLTAYGFFFAMITLAFFQTRADILSLGAHWDGWAVLTILAIGPSLIGYGLFTTSLRYLPAGVASLLATLEPALASVMAIFLLGEVLHREQWIGIGLILAAVVLVQWQSAAPQAAESTVAGATLPAATLE